MSPSLDGARPTKQLTRTSTVRSGPAVKGALEYGYPSGHLGHLTPEEEKTFEEFKTLLASHNLYTANPPSHDDATVLRFLRARRWDLAAAHAQFAATSAWRAAMDLDTLYDTIDVPAYESSRRLYPQWTGRRDRRGIPIYLFEIAHLDAKSVAAYEKAEVYSRAKTPPTAKEARLVRLFALYENLTRFTQPLCTQLGDRDFVGRTPITLSTNIVDVTGVSLKQYWNLKTHMQAASELATAHYPETLDRIFIIGAPAFFSTVWGWVKRWFDPVTVSKIFILAPAEVLPTLKSFIPTANIPKKYGGELEFKWNDRPKLDATIRGAVAWQNGHTEFPNGPVYWVPVDGGKRLECVARGTVDKKDRNEVIGSIAVAVAPEEVAPAAPTAPPANGEVTEPVSEASNPKADAAPPAVAPVAPVAATEPVSEASNPKGDDAPPAVAPVAAAAPPTTNGEQQTLAAPDAALPDVASPASDKPVDASEAPHAPGPVSPNAEVVDGVQTLSLGTDAPNEKVVEAAEAIPTSKPVTAA